MSRVTVLLPLVPLIEMIGIRRSASVSIAGGVARADRGDYRDGGGFFVLLIAGGGGSTFYETQFYNAQVRRADIDRDGVITEEEAIEYRNVVTKENE